MRVLPQRAPYLGAMTWAQLSAITNAQLGAQATVTDLGGALFIWNGTRWKTSSGNLILLNDWTDSTLTGTTTPSQLKTLILPANLLGPFGGVQVRVLVSQTNNANNKTTDIRVNNSSIGFATYTTTDNAINTYYLGNRGSSNSQRLRFTTSATPSNQGGNNGTQTFDTTSALTISIFGTVANAADTVTVNGIFVEAYIP